MSFKTIYERSLLREANRAYIEGELVLRFREGQRLEVDDRKSVSLGRFDLQYYVSASLL